MKLSFHVPEKDDGKPAFEILSQKGMSRLLIKRIRLYGQLTVNGLPKRMKDPLTVGDLVEATYKEDHEQFALRPNHGIPILYEDEWCIVCDKPADLVTHPSWQHMDDSLIQRLSDQTLHPVMRLDRETSGLIVVAKNGFAHHAISHATMNKAYMALVHGVFAPTEGSIDAPIGRSTDSIMLREVREDGRRAVTHYKTLAYNPTANVSLVRFVLETGRCHQIRVHSLSLGHPLLGDGLYGVCSLAYPRPELWDTEKDLSMKRQALHACELSFQHPESRETLHFVLPAPDDFPLFTLFPDDVSSLSPE